jgi:hypothetical protein
VRPEDFITMLKTEDDSFDFRIGTIPANYVSGRPTIQFDGESTAGSRTYPYLSSYAPAAGDRVLVAMVGHGGVVLGKIV